MAMIHVGLLGLSAVILGCITYLIVQQNLDAELENILIIFSVAIVFLMLCVVLVSFAISRFVVKRINLIAVTAQTIVETGDLTKRISIDTKWDDLSNLAQVLNGFLAQIEELMRSVREVNNNIAHDLRTPLTGLRADIESLKDKKVTAEELNGLLVDVDRILSVFHSLLRISNIQQGKRHQSFRELNLATVIEDVIELYEPVAGEKQIKLVKKISDMLNVRGDADLLFQLFANLLDNAIKFSRYASEVQINTRMSRGEVTVIIKDSGPGIQDYEKTRVFQQFYRGDESRSSMGYGLGLSLVKAVVDRHRGEIILKDGNPGLEVWITLQSYK